MVSLTLVLTGCSSTPSDEPDTTAAEAPAVEQVEEAAPLTAEPEQTFSDADQAYLFELRKRDDVKTIVEATDEQLVTAGHAACEMLLDNPYVGDLQLVEGETPRDNGMYFESSVIGTHAQMVLCPEVAIEHQRIG